MNHGLKEKRKQAKKVFRTKVLQAEERTKAKSVLKIKFNVYF